ncbi:MAG TPA: hypothetical protein DDX98_09640 [Bacteroidales bacterium]|jgi:hypothetical protein|nr:hypothetical protein [Bacteroidales bacterium]
MIQDIIVLIIVFSAAAYAVWSIVHALRKKTTSICGDNCGCSAKTDIKKVLLKNNKKSMHKNLELR